MTTLLFYLFIGPFLVLWVLFCLLLALIGLLIPRKATDIDLEEVKERKTVCKILQKKGLLTDEEYAFETEEVAARYDELTFSGYLFILRPFMFFLERVDSIDSFFMFLVTRWMAVHRVRFASESSRPVGFHQWFARFCAGFSNSVGRWLV